MFGRHTFRPLPRLCIICHGGGGSFFYDELAIKSTPRVVKKNAIKRRSCEGWRRKENLINRNGAREALKFCWTVGNGENSLTDIYQTGKSWNRKGRPLGSPAWKIQSSAWRWRNQLILSTRTPSSSAFESITRNGTKVDVNGRRKLRAEVNGNHLRWALCASHLKWKSPAVDGKSFQRGGKIIFIPTLRLRRIMRSPQTTAGVLCTHSQ